MVRPRLYCITCALTAEVARQQDLRVPSQRLVCLQRAVRRHLLRWPTDSAQLLYRSPTACAAPPATDTFRSKAYRWHPQGHPRNWRPAAPIAHRPKPNSALGCTKSTRQVCSSVIIGLRRSPRSVYRSCALLKSRGGWIGGLPPQNGVESGRIQALRAWTPPISLSEFVCNLHWLNAGSSWVRCCR